MILVTEATGKSRSRGAEEPSRATTPRRGSRVAAMAACKHLNQIRDVTPSADGCEDCLKIGASWVHLRLCLECGHVGCCDSSPNRHATKHFHQTKHPIVRSFEPGEDWRWCYIDEAEV
jgi:uncharacterized UBP type Zn finger protein